MAFDILEKKTGKFVSSPRLKQLVSNKIHLVPELASFKSSNFKDMATPNFEGYTKNSQIGSEGGEGVYIRIENDDYVLERCKFRKSGFIPGEDFHKQIQNKLK